MDCCGTSRRQALLWGSLAAAVPAIVGGVCAETANASTTGASTTDLLVTDLEVATVTDTSVIITWFTGSTTAVDTYGFPLPVAADTELQLGQWDSTILTIVPGTLRTVFQDSTATPYHYAEVAGLEPGVSYGYVALSNGQLAAVVPADVWPAAVPPGHAGGDARRPAPARPRRRPAARRRRPDVRRVPVGGERRQVAARRLGHAPAGLFRRPRQPRPVAERLRLGHLHGGAVHEPGPLRLLGDVFPYPLQDLQHYEVGGLRIVGLDTTTLDDAGGTMDAAQLGHLRDVLRQDRDRPTILFGHHSGHTHRNKRTYLLDDQQNPVQSVEFLEVGATKEYPGGYSLLRLYTGGYMVSYVRDLSGLTPLS